MSFLTPELAQKFILNTVKNLPYNVNIMDETGTIIATKDPSRMGDFHEVAHGMLTGTMDKGEVTDNDHFLGTKPGINMFVDYQDKHVGVICVTGDPETVRSFAGFVKASLETMMEYEIHMAQKQRTRGKEGEFLHHLLFSEEYNHDKALMLAGDFGIGMNDPATVLTIRSGHGLSEVEMVRAFSHGNGTIQRHIAVKGQMDDYIVLKILPNKIGDSIRNFRQTVDAYIEESLGRLIHTEARNSLTIYVGSIQNQLRNYRRAFNHAQTMSVYIKNPSGINYFFDHTLDSIRRAVPLNFYRDIFEVFIGIFRADEQKVLVSTIKALSANNYNLQKSALDLNVHRNTVIFRLNKVKDILDIDPTSSGKDREFLDELIYYFDKVE